MNLLFTPVTVKNITLRNRFVMAPMCMFSAGSEGMAEPWHTFHYRTRAQGGTSLIIQEATAVESRGRITAQDLGLWNDSKIPGLREVVKGIKEEGAVPAIQLAHAGRKCRAAGEDVIAPSPLAFDPDDPKENITPREMTQSDIETVVDSFKIAALRAREAGYQVLEIHGAHGYLISEFLSPLTNHRTDAFGGSLKKRAEFLRLVIKGVRSVWKEENPLILRVSALDYAPGGNEPKDLAEMINLVKDEGLDLIHVSSGGVVPHVTIPVGPAYQIPAAGIIRKLTGLPVIGGGMITNGAQAEKVLQDEEGDLVFLGRELLRNPFLKKEL